MWTCCSCFDSYLRTVEKFPLNGVFALSLSYLQGISSSRFPPCADLQPCPTDRHTHTQVQAATCFICTSAHHTDPDVRGRAGPQSLTSPLGSSGRRCQLFDQEVVPMTVWNEEPPETCGERGSLCVTSSQCHTPGRMWFSLQAPRSDWDLASRLA